MNPLPNRDKFTSTLRDTGFIIALVYVVALCFNSQAIVDWLDLKTDQEQPSGWSQALYDWHNTLNLLSLTSPRRRLKNFFQANIPLSHSDEIGFKKHEPPTMDMITLASRSRYWQGLGLDLQTLELDELPKQLDPIAFDIPQQRIPIGLGQESVLIIGDSIMGGIAPMIKRELRRQGHQVPPIIKWKISSGLARSDYYNWPKVADKLIKTNKVDVVVALFGTNDPFKPVRADNKSIPYRSQAWSNAYRLQVRKLQATLCQKAKTVYWLALPPMRKHKLNAETTLLNQIYQEVSADSSCVRFIPTKPLLANDKGGYTTYRIVGKSRKKIRESDGIHLTQHGGHLVARFILNQIDLDKEVLAH